MMAQKTIINYYEVKDGDELVIEFVMKENIINTFKMDRKVAIDLAHGILETLGEY